MRKLLYILIGIILGAPFIASASITVPWNRLSVGTESPLYSADGILVTASSTINANLSVSGLVSGNCVQASTGGLLTTVVGACPTNALTSDPNWSYFQAAGGNYIAPTSTSVGIGVFASSTIGNGNVTGGLTISGGATTTLNNFSQGFFNTSGTTGGYKIDNNLIVQASTTNSATLVGFNAGAALLASTTSAGNTAFGLNALEFATSSSYNTAVGYQALQQTSAGAGAGIGFNTAVGYQALVANTLGTQNVAVGGSALVANTTGIQNTAVGYTAGKALTSGSQNIFIGEAAGNVISSGSDNTVVGNAAAANGNATSETALGFFADENQGGTFNTVIGSLAAGHNTNHTTLGDTIVGSLAASTTISNYGYSSLFGYRSGEFLTSGANNTFLGAYAGQNITTGSNNILIGYNAIATSTTATNSLNIGNLIFGTIPATTTATNAAGSLPLGGLTGTIGIGTSSPFAEFSIQNSSLDTNNTLFAIASSSATATTTLFSVSNTGLTTIIASSTYAALNIVNTGGTSVGSSPYMVLSRTVGGLITNSPDFAVGAFGQTVIRGNAQNASLTINTGSATVKGLVLQASGGQTSQLMDVRDIAADSLFEITPMGSVGIGTTTPSAILSVVATSTIGGNVPRTLFTIASSTNGTSTTTPLSVANTGWIVTSGVLPTATSCGSTNSVSGNQTNGTVMFTGTLVTACTINFPNPVPSGTTLQCTESDNSLAATADISATTTSSITFGLSTGLAAGAITWNCEASSNNNN